MKRYRLVTQQDDGAPNISTVVLAEDEIDEQLDAEETLHRMSGWTVTRHKHTLVCRKKDIVRVITVRESDWMNDAI